METRFYFQLLFLTMIQNRKFFIKIRLLLKFTHKLNLNLLLLSLVFQIGSIFATLPRTQRGLPLILGGDPKGKTFLYPNGNSIIIRNIDHPEISDIYTEHSAPTTVAKYSPSGFYICSADQSGKVRIWDTTQKEHILKNEFQPFAGLIKDLSWSNDNQRIVAVGRARKIWSCFYDGDWNLGW